MHINSQIISYYSKNIFPCHLVLTRPDKLLRLYLISTFCCFVVPELLLLCFVGFFFYEAIFFRSYLVTLFLCFSVFLALQLFHLGKRANLSVFRTFVRFVLVWISCFPLPLGVWEGLRFVTVALPGLFSYLFFSSTRVFVLSLALCYSVLVIFSPFSIATTSLGE